MRATLIRPPHIGDVAEVAVGEEKVSGTNGTVEECRVSVEREETLLTRDQIFGILAVVW